MYASGTLFFRRLNHISTLGTRSYAFSRSTKTMWISLIFSLYLSCSILNANIGSVVDFPGLNPNWLSVILVISHSLAYIIFSHRFIVWLISLKTTWSSLFFSLYFSCSILNANIGSVVDFPGLNPNWLSAILVISLSLAYIILSHRFIVWLISLIPL